MNDRRRKRHALAACLLLIGLLALGAGTFAALRYGREIHTRLRYGIKTVHSPIDQNGNGLDDLTDLVRGARAYIRTQPEYVDSYYAGGYPPDGEGVCTDVIWRAFQAAGYDLKAMLDEDVRRAPAAYSIQSIDTNIDFRRVANLRVFFERSGCQSLPTDLSDWSQWQPGDVVVFDGHIAILSDRRGKDGRPFILHHAGYGAFEEDALDYKPILAHFRWIILPESQ